MAGVEQVDALGGSPSTECVVSEAIEMLSEMEGEALAELFLQSRFEKTAKEYLIKHRGTVDIDTITKKLFREGWVQGAWNLLVAGVKNQDQNTTHDALRILISGGKGGMALPNQSETLQVFHACMKDTDALSALLKFLLTEVQSNPYIIPGIRDTLFSSLCEAVEDEDAAHSSVHGLMVALAAIISPDPSKNFSESIEKILLLDPDLTDVPPHPAVLRYLTTDSVVVSDVVLYFRKCIVPVFNASRLAFNAVDLITAAKARNVLEEISAPLETYLLATKNFDLLPKPAICSDAIELEETLSRRALYTNLLSPMASIDIQRIYKGFVERNRFKKEVREKHIPAINIQRCYRGYTSRVSTDYMCQIVSVQRCVRGFLARRKAVRLRNRAVLDGHARVLQGFYKIVQAKRILFEMLCGKVTNYAANVIINFFKGISAKRQLKTRRYRGKHYRRLTTIQTVQIYTPVLREILTIQHAIRVLLAKIRFQKARREMVKRNAPCTMQRVWRGHLARKRCSELIRKIAVVTEAVVLIQKTWKGWITRHHWKPIMQSMASKQKIFREEMDLYHSMRGAYSELCTGFDLESPGSSLRSIQRRLKNASCVLRRGTAKGVTTHERLYITPTRSTAGAVSRTPLQVIPCLNGTSVPCLGYSPFPPSWKGATSSPYLAPVGQRRSRTLTMGTDTVLISRPHERKVVNLSDHGGLAVVLNT